MSFSMRRITITTSRINPPVHGFSWRATSDHRDHKGLKGLGTSEGRASDDLYKQINYREAAEEDQEEATEI